MDEIAIKNTVYDEIFGRGAVKPPPGRTEHFKFNLCDRVLLKEIQRPGVVDALLVDGLGAQYWVNYWNDSKRERALLFEWELELRNEE